MKLYLVQDAERPMHVVATDFGDAVRRWRAQIAKENPDVDCSDEEPHGVTLLAEGTDTERMPEILLPDAAFDTGTEPTP